MTESLHAYHVSSLTLYKLESRQIPTAEARTQMVLLCIHITEQLSMILVVFN